MKKLLAFALVVLMLTSLALPTFAAGKISAGNLENYGQLHWYLGEADASDEAPNVDDGVIGDDEYAINVELDPEDPHTAFEFSGSQTEKGITSSDWTWHFDHDDDYLYFAMTKVDPDYTPYNTAEDLDNDKFYDTFVMNVGSPKGQTTYEAISRLRFMTALGKDKDVNMTVNMFEFSSAGALTRRPLKAEDYVARSSGSYDRDTGLITIEFSVKRDAYEEIWECDLDTDPIYIIAMFLNYGPKTEGSTELADQGQIRHSFDYMNFEGESELRTLFKKDHPDAYFFTYLGPNVIHLYDRPVHVHSYGTSWVTNDDAHYHVCECGERSDEAEHTFDEGEIIKNATDKVRGEKLYTCTVCLYEKVEYIDRLPTQAPTKTPTKAPSQAPTSAPAAEEGGCGSALSLAAIAIVPALAVAFVAKKKED